MFSASSSSLEAEGGRWDGGAADESLEGYLDGLSGFLTAIDIGPCPEAPPGGGAAAAGMEVSHPSGGAAELAGFGQEALSHSLEQPPVDAMGSGDFLTALPSVISLPVLPGAARCTLTRRGRRPR